MYEEEIEQKEIEVKESIKESNERWANQDGDAIYTHDREDFVYEDEDGNFYNDLDDYDYQYRLLTNIL